MSVRPINLESDLPAVLEWWAKRGSKMPAAAFLPAQGFIAELNGVLVAASWLYVVPGTKGGIGIIEFTATNPNVATSRDLLIAVKELYAVVEQAAWDGGCGSVLSFVAPGSSEEHIMKRGGWNDITGGVHHLMLGRVRCL